jgi:hypothetical protein
MSFFKQFSNDADKFQEKFLGPDYNYAKNILSPTDLNILEFGGENFNIISNNGLSELAADFGGLIDYVELLVSGTTVASKTTKPLGNRFFLPTAAKCKGNNSEQTRHVYINNIPTGSIPIISNIAGKDFTEFRGLIPGVFSELQVLNPLKLFSGIFVTSDSSCSEVELSVVDNKNTYSFEKHYVLNQDIKKISPCVFKNQINTLTNETCKESEAFTNINHQNFKEQIEQQIKNNINLMNISSNDNLIKIYFITLTILYFYIFLKLLLKK